MSTFFATFKFENIYSFASVNSSAQWEMLRIAKDHISIWEFFLEQEINFLKSHVGSIIHRGELIPCLPGKLLKAVLKHFSIKIFYKHY